MLLYKQVVKGIVLFLASIFCTNLYSQPAGYSYGKEITIANAKIAGTVANFPVLVSVTDANLKTVGNGGHVQNANGWDIVFTLTDCNTLLSEQIESYTATTGTILIWVRIPNLPAGSNYKFFMYYGNSTVATNPSTTATWDANYVSIWHLDENPAGVAPQYADVTSHVESGTTHNMVAADQVAGIIGKAGSFNGSSMYVTMGGGPPWPTSNTAKTLSVWAEYTAIPSGNQNFLSFTQSSISTAYQIGFRGSIPLGWDWGGGSLAQAASAPSINAWHYYVYTYDGTNNDFYVDGVLAQTTTTATQTGTPDQGSFGCYMQDPVNTVGGEYFGGLLDEGRLSKTNRSANWIKTEYNNQNSPATFYTFSIEYTAALLCSVLPIQLLYFTGQTYDTYNTLLWSTATETNNNFFTVERTTDNVNWTEIGTVKGAGNSTHVIDYSLNDDSPESGVNYYRLKQTDLDGNFTYSNVVALSNTAAEAMKVYPNPTNSILNIQLNEETSPQTIIELYNLTGQKLYTTAGENLNEFQINMSPYPAGIYCVVVYNGGKAYKQKVIKQ